MRRFTLFAAVAACVAVVFVPSASAIAFDDQSFSPPTGIAGKPYPKFGFHIREGGGCPPYHYTVTSGNFPPGLSLGEDSGDVTGTPTAAGDWSFWVTGRDSGPAACGFPNDPRPPAETQREFTIKIIQGLSVQQQSLKPTVVNQAYSFQLTATGGGSQTWSIASGDLAPGVTLSPSGLLAGTPTTTGSFTFVVKVADIGNHDRDDTETLTLKVVEPLTVQAPATIPGSEVGRRFALAPTAAGGTAPYAWTVSQGTLPEGLALDPASGAITGTPTAAGAASITLTITDADGFTATLPLAIDVKAKLAIATTRLPGAKVGRRYSGRIVARGGVVPRTWRLIHGPLPRGLRFDTARGMLVGTPRKAGAFTITVRARDSLGAISTATVSLTVRA